MFHRILFILASLLTVSCQMKPYAPPPQRALVESVVIEVLDFEGRPDAHAIVKGRLSSSAAQLVDARQSRENGILYLEVLEQTPRGATLLPDLGEAPPFETRIPIEVLGMDPGPCTLNTNGIEVVFEIPALQAVLVPAESERLIRVSPITLLDEFIPIEDAVPAMSVPAGGTPQ